MKIDIILPYKEIFSETKASAVSLTVKNAIEYSEFKSNIKVYGQTTNNPFFMDNFIGLKTNKIMHLGNNRSLLINYIKLKITEKKVNTIVEIHNRPYLFHLALEKLSNYPISLHFHNDPTTMKGSVTILERIKIAREGAAIYFVSNFIKEQFLKGIDEKFHNLHVLPNGIQRRLSKAPNKIKEILFIGRLVPEKGSHLFVNSIKNIVAKYPEWNFKIIGAAKAGQENLKTKYEKDVINNFLSLGKNVTYLGFVPNNVVKKSLETASILIVPSLWDDPFPLTALEGLSYGVAIIASNKGGLKEMLNGKAMLLEDINEKNLEKSIIKLISDKDLLEEYQKKSWDNYIYNQNFISKKQDQIRKQILKDYYN